MTFSCLYFFLSVNKMEVCNKLCPWIYASENFNRTSVSSRVHPRVHLMVSRAKAWPP